MKFRAFTLAEVLITLGIVGVVAAMTIPNLIVANEKRTTITKLKKTYSELIQAVRLAEGEYGAGFPMCDYPSCNWEYDKSKATFEKYIMPYLNGARAYSQADSNKLTTVYSVNGIKLSKPAIPCFQMKNGTVLGFSHSTQEGFTNVSLWVYTNSDLNKKKILGRHVYNFVLFDKGNGYTLETVTRLRDNTIPRETLVGYCAAAENKATVNIGAQTSIPVSAPCTELIMRDGWRFADDYPIKFK